MGGGEDEVLHSVAKKRLQSAGLVTPRAAEQEKDFREMKLSAAHSPKPFWLLPDGRIVLDSSSPVYREASDFLVAISEPKCRTKFLEEYQLTHFSLYAGASMGLRTEDILQAMHDMSKTAVPEKVEELVKECTERYGKVKLQME